MTNNSSKITKQALIHQISNVQSLYVPKIDDLEVNDRSSIDNLDIKRILAFNKRVKYVKEPKLNQWEYLNEEKVQKLLEIENSNNLSEFIASTLDNFPKGCGKQIFIELISDVANFCKRNHYNIEKSGCILSQFYLTHLYFISGLEVSAEKVYIYFKELLMCHNLPFPPGNKKIFTIKESKDILEFFCKVYIRNLPLIKYLCLSNYALYLNYEIPAPPPLLTIKEKKSGKDKKKAKGKKK